MKIERDIWYAVSLDTRMVYWFTEYQHSVTMAKFWYSRWHNDTVGKPMARLRAERVLNEYRDRQGFAFREIMMLYDMRVDWANT
jgi:hypothetical protein